SRPQARIRQAHRQSAAQATPRARAKTQTPRGYADPHGQVLRLRDVRPRRQRRHASPRRQRIHARLPL
ncbi:MAG: hypothetical protein GTN78_14700, partial [Gemmatimonadales bacterium]|nr:hypothetical protein [Gemmatimonadales bacterium]